MWLPIISLVVMVLLPSWQEQPVKPMEQVMHAASWGNSQVFNTPVAHEVGSDITAEPETETSLETQIDALVEDEVVEDAQSSENQAETENADNAPQKVAAYNNRSEKEVGFVSEKAVEKSPTLDPAKPTVTPSPQPTVSPSPSPLPSPSVEPQPSASPSPIPIEPPIFEKPKPSIPPCTCSPQPGADVVHGSDVNCPMVMCPEYAAE